MKAPAKPGGAIRAPPGLPAASGPSASSASAGGASNLENRVLALESGLKATQDTTRRLESAASTFQNDVTQKLGLLLQAHGLEAGNAKRRHVETAK